MTNNITINNRITKNIALFTNIYNNYVTIIYIIIYNCMSHVIANN